MKKLLGVLLIVCTGLFAQASMEITSSGVGFGPGNSFNAIDFGYVYVNTRKIARFDIRNNGEVPVTFSRDYTWGIDFSSYHDCYGTLLPNQSCRVEIEYYPPFDGFSHGRFEIRFVEETFSVELRGRAIRRP